MNSSSSTQRATFVIGDETAARRVVDRLNESLDDDQAAVAAFERADGRWEVSLHFAEAPDQASVRELVSLAAGDAIAKAITFDTVEAKDWVAASLDDLAPVHAGRFVVHGRHDRARVPANKLGIEIEAALAFGTGHHGTTRGCLLLLDHVLRSRAPRRVLDLGSGTGVLAIAAAKALRRGVLASDIDPVSVKVARDNARLNGVGPLLEAIHANGFAAPRFASCGPFDLVLANILANPLRQLATPMAAHLAPSAFVILSGLLPQQARGVIASYRARGLVLRRHLQIEGWSSLLLQRGVPPSFGARLFGANPESRGDIHFWIPGLRPRAHPGMTGLVIPGRARFARTRNPEAAHHFWIPGLRPRATHPGMTELVIPGRARFARTRNPETARRFWIPGLRPKRDASRNDGAKGISRKISSRSARLRHCRRGGFSSPALRRNCRASARSGRAAS